MQSLLHAARALERLSSFIGRLGAWLIVALMLVIITDVTLRHWFVIGSTKLQELEWHLHGGLFLLCLGWAYTKGAHVRIELISERFSPRTQAWIELLGCLLLLLPYVIAILHFGVDYTSFSYAFNESSASATGLPDRWIIKGAIVFGFAILGIAGVARALNAVVFLFGGDELGKQTPFSVHHEMEGAS